MTGLNADRDLNPYNTDITQNCHHRFGAVGQQVSIAALQETYLAGAGSIKEKHYTYLWLGKASEESPIYGTAYDVSNNLLSILHTPYTVNDRISGLKLNSQQGGIRIIHDAMTQTRTEKICGVPSIRQP